jgi:hypothetical protein
VLILARESIWNVLDVNNNQDAGEFHPQRINVVD